jgi:hypothetical protein
LTKNTQKEVGIDKQRKLVGLGGLGRDGKGMVY